MILGDLQEAQMSVCFFATPLASGYSKGEEHLDTSIFDVVRKGKIYAESKIRSATKRGTR
jgi:hypothetical protein